MRKVITRACAIILTVVMMLSFVPTSAILLKTKATGNITEFAGGSGTESDPYLISTSEHLNNVRNYPEAHFRMVNDIDFVESSFATGGSFYNSGKGWEPIGTMIAPFKGVFNGDGHSINGVKVNVPKGNSYAINYAGIFGYVEGATIQNLTTSGGTVYAYKNSFRYAYSGGIAAFCRNTTFVNCHNGNAVQGYNAGGIAGACHGGSFTNCTNSGVVSRSSDGHSYGGILGTTSANNDAYGVALMSFANCHNYGVVDGGSSTAAGGIIGFASSSKVTMELCSNSGAVGSSSTNHAGGIIGASYNDTIDCCFNNAKISGGNAGGIIGNNGYDSGDLSTVTNSYNVGQIVANHNYFAYAGGISGNGGRISECYNIGTVTANASSKIVTAGIAAKDSTPTDVTNCYTTNAQSYSYSCGATLCALTDMKNRSTYTGFDFDSIWSISEEVNSGYPYLKKVLATIDLENVTMALYSVSKSLTICKGDTVEYAIQMKSGGQIIYGPMIMGDFDFSFASSDDAVFRVSDIKYVDDGVIFSVTGLQEGEATLTITENNTQNVLATEVWVTNGIQAFNADALPSYYDAGNEYNGYINGIYIDNFSSENQADGYSVSFDAYNMHCVSGIVLVYDAQGKLYDFAIIDRFDGGNITSLGDWVMTSCSLIGDLFSGNLLSYKANHLSKKTSISLLKVPYGGKIEITNNVQYSDACALYNYVDIIVTAVGLAMDIATDSPEKNVSKEVSTSFVAEYMLEVFGDATKREYSKLATRAKEKLIENSTEKVLVKGMTDRLAGFVDEGKTIIAETEIDLEEIIRDVAMDLGLGIPADALQEAMGPFGEILKDMFTVSQYSNFLSFYLDLVKTASKQAFVIQFSGTDGSLNDNGVSIKPNSSLDLAKENYVLQSQVVSKDMLDNTSRDALDTATDTQKYVLREVSLECDNEIVQPEEPVTISIPLPDNYIADKSKVYVFEDGTLTQIDSVCEDGTFSFTTNELQCYVIAQADELKFSGASLSLQHNLAINYKVDKALFEDVGYTDPYVVFELNGVKTRMSNYSIDGDRYVFTFRNIAPNQMSDTIYATLYATYDGVEYASATREYSVAEYCYSMLELCSADDYAELQTLLVDLLHYGAASQTYTGYRTDALVNAFLTDAQLLWGTSEDPALDTVLDTTCKTVENPTAVWKGAGLNLQDSVSMRLKFTAESIDGLTIKIESGENSWTIPSNKFLEEDGVYYVYFAGLNAGQMRQSVYLTIYDGDTPVSNTVCYSIGSYAYEKQNSTIAGLPELVKAMMRYGDSAHIYVN